jgi:formylglycine-generating enzyme required for sulfatase activity
MVEVSEGLFVYGTTEQQFKQIISTRTMNFPGMEERLRKAFEIPEKTLSLPGFFMDSFEVTNEDFRDFVVETGYRPEKTSDYLKHWKNATEFPSWAATFPVVWVSQQDAQAFCAWKGKRLPTEQEWEKAARGDSGFTFPWGDVRPTRDTANFLTGEVEPIGNRPDDCSPFGIYDMAGNVSELTSSVVRGRFGPRVVVRGGCYKAASTEMVTFYRRTNRGPNDRSEHVGFRCAAD